MASYNFRATHEQVFKTLGWWFAPKGDASRLEHPLTGHPYAPDAKGGSFPEAILRLAAEGEGELAIVPKRLGAAVIVVPHFLGRPQGDEVEQRKQELRGLLLGKNYAESTPSLALHIWGAWPKKELGDPPGDHPIVRHLAPMPFYAAPLAKGMGLPPKVPLNRPLPPETVMLAVRVARLLGAKGPKLPWEE